LQLCRSSTTVAGPVKIAQTIPCACDESAEQEGTYPLPEAQLDPHGGRCRLS
jgi:MoxR-like ATPase